jgi:hypothetical protein
VWTATYSDEKRTLGAYLQDWLEHKQLQIKPGGLEFYRHYVDKNITKTLGGVKLQTLSTQQVRNFLVAVS